MVGKAEGGRRDEKERCEGGGGRGREVQGFEEGRGMRGRGRGKVEVGGRQGGVCDGGVLRRVTPGIKLLGLGLELLRGAGEGMV